MTIPDTGSTYVQLIQTCEAAIVRIRAAIRAGAAQGDQTAADLTLVRNSLRPRLIGLARRNAQYGPDSFEETLEALENCLVDDILNLNYQSLETGLGAYLNTRTLRILQQVARNYGRTSVSLPVVRLDRPIGEDGATYGDSVADEQASAVFDRLGEREALDQAIGMLPSEERYVIEQRLTDVENSAIARALGVSDATATRIYQRALANLRRLLQTADGGSHG